MNFLSKKITNCQLGLNPDIRLSPILRSVSGECLTYWANEPDFCLHFSSLNRWLIKFLTYERDVNCFSDKNWLYSKGADSSMLERIKKGDLVTLKSHINDFAKVFPYKCLYLTILQLFLLFSNSYIYFITICTIKNTSFLHCFHLLEITLLSMDGFNSLARSFTSHVGMESSGKICSEIGLLSKFAHILLTECAEVFYLHILKQLNSWL